MKRQNSFKRVMNNKTMTFETVKPNAVDMELTRLAYVATSVISIVVTFIGILTVVVFKIPSGWVIIGLGILLGLSLLNLLVSPSLQGVELMCKKKSENLSQPFYYHGLNDFPPDPVLQRATTFLTHHGQDDCELCRKMREEENNLHRQDPPVTSPELQALDQHSDEGSLDGIKTPLHFRSRRNSPPERSRTPNFFLTPTRGLPQDGFRTLAASRTPQICRTPRICRTPFGGSQVGLDRRKFDRKDDRGSKPSTKITLSINK